VFFTFIVISVICEICEICGLNKAPPYTDNHYYYPINLISYNTPKDICAGNVKEYRRRLLEYLTRSLSRGIESGEFAPVPLEETAIMILSVINGIVRYSRMNPDPEKILREAAVEFCRRSLMKFSKAEIKSGV